MKQYAVRHGDLALVTIDELPSGLKEADTKVLMTGSNDNPHTFDNGKVYFKNVSAFVFGYLVAKDTKLFHISHGKEITGKKLREVSIQNGIFELRRQNEFTHEGMKKVID